MKSNRNNPSAYFFNILVLQLALFCLPQSYTNYFVSIFLFYDVPNIFSWQKVYIAGRPVQHPDSYTAKPCCCSRCNM